MRLPLQVGELVSGVEDHPRDRDRRLVERDGFLHAGRRRRRLDGRRRQAGIFPFRIARIRAAVSDGGPAVVLPGADDVDLVAALRAVFGFPQLARLRMDRQADRVADAEREDLRLVAGASHERVVLRRRAVVVQPQDLAAVLGRATAPRRWCRARSRSPARRSPCRSCRRARRRGARPTVHRSTRPTRRFRGRRSASDRRRSARESAPRCGCSCPSPPRPSRAMASSTPRRCSGSRQIAGVSRCRRRRCRGVCW